MGRPRVEAPPEKRLPGVPAFDGYYPLSVSKLDENSASMGSGYGANWVAGDVLVHTPNDPGGFSYQWTSPVSGIVNVSGGVWYAHGNTTRGAKRMECAGWPALFRGRRPQLPPHESGSRLPHSILNVSPKRGLLP
jgi:hypothetical protein